MLAAKRVNALLVVSLLLNLFFGSFYLVRRISNYRNSSVESTKAYWNDTWNINRNSIYNNLKIDSGDIVFVGNSLTEAFPLNETFKNTRIRNRGINGNECRHILARLDFIILSNPSAIFLEMGINDLIEGKSAHFVSESYIEAIKKIQTHPEIKIVTQSVTPLNGSYKIYNDSVRAINKAVSDYSAANGITFIDINTDLLKGNDLNESYTYDGVHLNGTGYTIWAKKLKPLLE